MSAHTPTPWDFDAGDFAVYSLSDESVVCSDITEADAAHIVNCVNERAGLVRQRDELLDALQEVRSQCRNAVELGATGPGYYEDLLDTVNAALAKAEAA